jgi:hypothetical protein
VSTLESDAEHEERIHSLLTATRDRLSAAHARDEALAEFIPEHRGRLFRKKAAMQPLGRVWRLGVLLLDSNADLYETGHTTRALEPGRPAYQSLSAEQRREYRGAAFRAKFAAGETVNFDARPIDISVPELKDASGALFVRDNRFLVRWSPTGTDDAAVELEAYLNDRATLLLEPPEGA